MPETMELTPLEEASKLERKLRRERAEISHRIAEAAATVRDLRGGGHRDGDPVLEEAKEAVGALVDRESVLPQLILDAVAERCRLRAEQLAEEERELARAAEPLQDVAARAHRAQEKARRKANEAQSLLEGNEIAREKLRQERRIFDDFARAEAQTEGEKRLRLLESARAEGLLLPFDSFEADL